MVGETGDSAPCPIPPPPTQKFAPIKNFLVRCLVRCKGCSLVGNSSDCAINSPRNSTGAQRLLLHVLHENLYIPGQKHLKLLISPSMTF